MSLEDLGVGNKVVASKVLSVALLVPPREANYTMYAKNFMVGVNVAVYSGVPRPPLAKLARKFKLIVTSRLDVLKMLANTSGDVPSVFNFQGSTFRYKGATVVIIDNIKGASFDAKYCIRTQQYILKILNPEIFPPQDDFNWKHLAPEDCYPSYLDKLLSIQDKALAVAVDIETVPYAHGQTTCITMVGFTAIMPDLTLKTTVIPLRSMAQYKVCKELLAHKAHKIMHGGRYDCTVLLKWGLPPRNYTFDTMTMYHSWLHDLPKSLNTVTAFCVRDSQYWKEGRKASSSYDKMLYNARDCVYTALSFLFILVRCPKWSHGSTTYKQRRTHYAIKMGYRGMNTSESLRKAAILKAEPARDSRLTSIRTIVGNEDFNPNSSKQTTKLMQILANKRMKVSNADAKILDKIKELDAFSLILITLISEYREACKLIGTYLNAELTDSNRLLYGLNVTGTTSDRWASNTSDLWGKPPLGAKGQHLKTKKSLGQAVMVFTRTKGEEYFLPSARAFVIADEGMVLGSCDLPQSESRFTAYLSGDENLIEAVESPLDFHKTNASKFFGVKYDDITPELRQLGKPVNHGANYNMAEYVLIETMGIKNIFKARDLLNLPPNWSSWKVAKHLLDAFKEAYPNIKGSSAVPLASSWYGSLIREVVEYGKIATEWGWTKMVLGNPLIHKPTLNNLASAKPQNMSAEYLHRGLDYLEANHTKEGEFEILAPIHDEILFQCRKGTEEKYSGIVVKALTQTYTLNGRTFTITPDAPCYGSNWSLIH